MLVSNLQNQSGKSRARRTVKPVRERKSGGHVLIVTDLCKGCELCVEACPPDVLKIAASLNVMGYHPASYVGDGCTGCGVCFYVCPEPGAITVYKKKDLA